MADVMQAYMESDHFLLRPANPSRRCTINRGLGIGVMGAGGGSSVLAVNVKCAFTHIAGIAVATSRVCADGTVLELESPSWFEGKQ